MGDEVRVPSGAKAVYDAVARDYAEALGDELAAKPLDRALLAGFAELVGTGTIADLGCGPGHVTRFLADRHPDVVGVDLSPQMVAVAREREPGLEFAVGSLLELPAADGAWAGVVCFYSIIHLDPAERAVAFAELARTLAPKGRLLLAFHVEAPEIGPGGVNHLREWFGREVEIDGYFLDPEAVRGELEAAGFAVGADLRREPIPGAEYPSRRCYLLAETESE